MSKAHSRAGDLRSHNREIGTTVEPECGPETAAAALVRLWRYYRSLKPGDRPAFTAALIAEFWTLKVLARMECKMMLDSTNESAANGTPTPPASSDLRAQAREAFRAAGLTQASAASEIGISDATLSQWLKRGYGGDNEGVAAKVGRWLDARIERTRSEAALPDVPEWAETPTARRVLGALWYAQLAGDIAVVYGGAGLGKTTAAKRYAGTKPSVWVATMSPSAHTLHACLERAAAAVGIRLAHGRAARIEADLADRLEGTRGLLVVDEAQHLSVQALEGLRSLHDATRTGLALVGGETLWSRLTGGRRAAEFAQLYSRVGKRVRLARATQGDADALLAAWGLSGKEEREAARRIAAHAGGLRGLSKALRLAPTFAAGGAVAARHLRQAWADLGGNG
ncbi:MAG: AAA family ATPase [Chloroflexi bacterium]|nr:AAA family ATPase [Chloroflexota bacterium]